MKQADKLKEYEELSEKYLHKEISHEQFMYLLESNGLEVYNRMPEIIVETPELKSKIAKLNFKKKIGNLVGKGIIITARLEHLPQEENVPQNRNYKVKRLERSSKFKRKI